jgi:diguanylate cyclase (GGDEF)-like protein
MIVVGTAFTLPSAWRLSKRFWGARVILLVLIVILSGKIVNIATHWSAGDVTSSDHLTKMFLAETIISMALTMGFLVLLQEQVRQRLVELSVSDPLTGLYNRRGLLSLLQRDLERARRTQNPLSMVLFDLDHFKRVNDSAGHDAGDAVLRGFAACLRATFRRTDVIGRWGGEEFVVVMPGIDVREAAMVAERVRVALRGRPLAEGAAPITVSGGVAGADLSLEVHQAMSGLIAAADRRMYDAKVQRDSVCASELSPQPA